MHKLIQKIELNSKTEDVEFVNMIKNLVIKDFCFFDSHNKKGLRGWKKQINSSDYYKDHLVFSNHLFENQFPLCTVPVQMRFRLM